MRPSLRPAAAVQPHEHGQYIYAYSHARTNQVLYSLKRSLDGHHSLKQLPDLGANDPKAEGRLRRDLWRPFFSVSFPPTPSDNSSPHGSNSNAQGLHAYRKLREWRKLHEYHWTPPASLAKPYTEEQIDALKKRYDERGGSKKETVYDMIKREKKKVRLREVWDQKANSVADLAAVLKEQYFVREGMEDESDQTRNDEVAEMLELADKAKNEGFKKIDAELRSLRPYLERTEGSRIEDGAPMSQRQAKKRAWELNRLRNRMHFASEAVEKAETLVSIFDRIEKDLEEQIAGPQEEQIEVPQTSSAGEPSTEQTEQSQQSGPSEEVGSSTAESTELTESQKAELQIVLAGVRQAKIEILKYGVIGLGNVQAWIDNPQYAPTERKDTNASQIVNAPRDTSETSEVDSKVKGYQLVLTAVSDPGSEQLSSFKEQWINQERKARAKQAKEQELAELVRSKAERLKANVQQLATKRREQARDRVMQRERNKSEEKKQEEKQRTEMLLTKLEQYLPGKLQQLEQEMADLESQAPADRQDRLARLQNRKAVAEAQLEAFKEVHTIRADPTRDNIVELLERRLLEVAKGFENEATKVDDAGHHTRASRVYLGQSKVFRFALGAERGWHADYIYPDTKKDSVYLIGTKMRLRDRDLRSTVEDATDTLSELLSVETSGERTRSEGTISAPDENGTNAQETQPEDEAPIEFNESAWPPRLASFPPERSPPEDLFPKKQVKHTKRQIRRQRAPLFTMQGVRVKFNNVLDAEYAEEWPEDVIIEGMGLTKGMSAPKADDEPIYSEMEWRQKQRELSKARTRRDVIDALARDVVQTVRRSSSKEIEKMTDKEVVVKEVQPVLVEERKQPAPETKEELTTEQGQEKESPMVYEQAQPSVASRVRGWFGR